MEIPRIVSTFTQKQYPQTDEEAIRISIRWKLPNEKKYQVVAINVGHKISPKNWNESLSRVNKGAKNTKYVSYFEINKDIQHREEVINTAFKKFEVKGRVPSKKELRDTVNHLLGKYVGKPSELITFKEAFTPFMLDLSKKKSLAKATIAKWKTMKTSINEFDSELRLDEITKSKLEDYVDYLLTVRNQQNTTVKKNMTFVMSFLKYCKQRGLINTDWEEHTIELKTVKGNQLIFFDMDEFNKIYDFQFNGEAPYLERARDVFCFQCLTALRYSDIFELKKGDITVRTKEMLVVTDKGDKILNIPLSNKAMEILDKYKDLDGEKALPVISLTKMNKYLKELCFLIGFNELITKTYMKGRERITETKPKHELISTHAARRTFICIALMSGVAAEVVMRITGHEDYKSMLPYIDVTNKAKIEAVKIFD